VLLAACKRNRTWRRAHEECSGTDLRINMRKGEPKVVQKTDRQAFKGERRRPGAATRYFIARRRIAGRLHLSHAINL
jgi:hypothetical protein